MKYRDLNIETRRESPAGTRTTGAALLARAGYVTADGQSTELGKYAIAGLRASAKSPPDFFDLAKLRVLRTPGGEVLFEVAGGDTQILKCPACGYAARLAIAKSAHTSQRAEAMLPVHKIATPNCSSIDALAAFLAIPKARTAKAMMYTRVADRQFVFVVLRGDTQISEQKLKSAVGDVQLATAEQVAAAGAVAGYASPIGLRQALVVVDDLLPASPNLVAGANEAGFHLENTNCGRDYEAEVVTDLTLARAGDPCPTCGSPLIATAGYLVADDAGYRFESLLLALAETYHDEHGLCLPSFVTPFEVYLLQLASREMDTRAKSDELYGVLQAAGASVLYDDRDERAGVKFNDADLIGCPIRLTVGERNLKRGMVEFKYRNGEETHLVPIDDVVEAIRLPPGAFP